MCSVNWIAPPACWLCAHTAWIMVCYCVRMHTKCKGKPVTQSSHSPEWRRCFASTSYPAVILPTHDILTTRSQWLDPCMCTEKLYGAKWSNTCKKVSYPLLNAHPALPCPALPCPALSCPVLSCPVLPCPTLPWNNRLQDHTRFCSRIWTL
jgi:hypothetical protein